MSHTICYWRDVGLLFQLQLIFIWKKPWILFSFCCLFGCYCRFLFISVLALESNRKRFLDEVLGYHDRHYWNSVCVSRIINALIYSKRPLTHAAILFKLDQHVSLLQMYWLEFCWIEMVSQMCYAHLCSLYLCLCVVGDSIEDIHESELACQTANSITVTTNLIVGKSLNVWILNTWWAPQNGILSLRLQLLQQWSNLRCAYATATGIFVIESTFEIAWWQCHERRSVNK